MATTPPRPPSNRPTPANRPGQPGRPGTPGRPAPPKSGARGGAAGPAAPGARQGPRKAERIRYAPAKIQESQWGRKVLIGVVALAVVVGTIGWYRYLTRPPVAVKLPVAAPTTEGPDAPATPAPPASARVLVPEPAAPLTLPAKEIAADLAAQTDVPQAQAFAQRYRDREVTWSGTVTSVSRVEKVLRFDFNDSDGMKLTAWCVTDIDLAQGANVTVRGKLAGRQKEGFSIDRCQIL